MQTLWLRYLTEIKDQARWVPAELLANPELSSVFVSNIFVPLVIAYIEQWWAKLFMRFPSGAVMNLFTTGTILFRYDLITMHVHHYYLSPVKSLHIYWSMPTSTVQDAILSNTRWHLEQQSKGSSSSQGNKFQVSCPYATDIEKHRYHPARNTDSHY